ncbi:hypothetical protein ACYOEI_22400 [Singulisphaera rosea]
MKLPTRRELLVCLAITLCLCAYLFHPFYLSENFGKPLGQDTPTEPPDEANRLVHPLGFSIVYPPNWVPRIQVEDKSIVGEPRKLIPSRTSATIYARKLGVIAPELSECRPIEFQGQPAYEESSRRDGNWDEPPRFSHHIFFQRRGDWYQLSYWIGADPPALPETIRRFINTFRAK